MAGQAAAAAGPHLKLADASRVNRLLDRLARRIGAEICDETAMVGILRRGAPLARMLASRSGRAGFAEPEVGELKLKRYADDLTLLHEQPKLDEETLNVDVEGRHLVLVDDVIYSGESLFRSCCFLRANGARRIQLAVLCARGVPEMPMRPDFVGLRLDVGPRWIIDCAVPPYEDDLGIDIKMKSDEG